ncbi:MAG: calcium-binding protein [Lentilitoribacter sp.]
MYNQTIIISNNISIDELNEIIENAPLGADIILENGQYNFDDSLVINRSDIDISGQSESGVVLNFDLENSSNTDAVIIGERSYEKSLATVSSQSAVNDSTLSVDDAGAFSVGDIIYVSQDNTDEYLTSKGDTEYNESLAERLPFRETMAKVIGIEGDTLVLEGELGQEFDPGLAEIKKVDAISDVSFGNLTVQYNFDQDIQHNNFDNTLDGYDDAKTIAVYEAVDLDISSVSILNSASHGLYIRSSLDVNVDGLFVNGHYDKAAGNGYGLEISEVFGSSFTNLELFNSRHAFAFSSWHAENYNSVHILETNRDVNFHGSFDHSNTVVVDKSILEYDPTEHTGDYNGYWDSVGTAGQSHVDTDIYGDNEISFGHLEEFDPKNYTTPDNYHTSARVVSEEHIAENGGTIGTSLDDRFYMIDGESAILADAGDDVIRTGAGDDVIFAGSGNDRIVAGEGDNIIFGEDGTDRIVTGSGSDYVDGGAGDDVLYSQAGNDEVWGGSGNDRINSGAGDDLVLGQDGADIIRGGVGDDIVFGGDDNDRLFGDQGDDVISGGAGDDRIYGGVGNDTLIAGAGNDIMVGGNGADTFIIADNKNGTDVITDFNAEVDKIVFGGAFEARSIEDVDIFHKYGDTYLSLDDQQLRLADVLIDNLSCLDCTIIDL